MRSKLLGLLKQGKWVSSKTLAKKIKVSRQALHKQISFLRKRGYKIQAKPRVGYKLLSKPDLLLPEEIIAGLRTKRMGKKIFYFDAVDSTQNKAKELAEKGEPEGSLVIAEEQSAGRGRLGRKWESPRGGIWCSLILRPSLPPQNVPVLSLVISLAVSKVIEKNVSVSCGLKWPNDVMILDTPHPPLSPQGERRKVRGKVCGILIEMSAEAGRTNWVVAGIGLNVNNTIPTILKSQAITLKEAKKTKTPLQRVSLLQLLLTEIEKSYEQFLNEGFDKMKKDYLKKSFFLGKKITVLDEGKKITGKFVGIAEDGSLNLETEDSKQIQIISGEVSDSN